MDLRVIKKFIFSDPLSKILRTTVARRGLLLGRSCPDEQVPRSFHPEESSETKNSEALTFNPPAAVAVKDETPAPTATTSKTTISHNHAELVSILTRCLEKKAEKVLNDPKEVGVPWELYDVAVSAEYEMIKRNGHPAPIHLPNHMKRRVIKKDVETQQRRLAIYAGFREEELVTDELLLRRLERKQIRDAEKLEKIKLTLPDFDGSRGFYDTDGNHVLGPRCNLSLTWDATRIARWAAGNLNFALNFGQDFVIDLDLPYEMEDKEVRSLHSQMEEIYRTNRWLWEPYKIHLCGYNADNQVMNNLVSSLESQLWHVTPECFTHVFPPERLVYLSPDSPNVLTEYSQDDVYILGALIDKRIPKKYTYDKAQRLGIRSARLDLGTYLHLTRQKLPYLAFSDVFQVMIDARDTDGNWIYAFRNLIDGRKRILRWRDELGEDKPAPPPHPSTYGERLKSKLNKSHCYKDIEKERAVRKPKRNYASCDFYNGGSVSGMELLYHNEPYERYERQFRSS